MSKGYPEVVVGSRRGRLITGSLFNVCAGRSILGGRISIGGGGFRLSLIGLCDPGPSGGVRFETRGERICDRGVDSRVPRVRGFFASRGSRGFSVYMCISKGFLSSGMGRREARVDFSGRGGVFPSRMARRRVAAGVMRRVGSDFGSCVRRFSTGEMGEMGRFMGSRPECECLLGCGGSRLQRVSDALPSSGLRVRLFGVRRGLRLRVLSRARRELDRVRRDSVRGIFSRRLCGGVARINDTGLTRCILREGGVLRLLSMRLQGSGRKGCSGRSTMRRLVFPLHGASSSVDLRRRGL